MSSDVICCDSVIFVTLTLTLVLKIDKRKINQKENKNERRK